MAKVFSRALANIAFLLLSGSLTAQAAEPSLASRLDVSYSLTLRELLISARETHPGIASAYLQQQAAQEDVNASKRRQWPELTATVESNSGSIGSYPSRALRLEQILWDAGQVRARIGGARAQEELAGMDLSLQQQYLSLQIIDAWQKLMSGMERAQVARSALERLRAYQLQMYRRTEAQASPLIDLELVNARLLQTEVELKAAQLAIQMAVVQLEQQSNLPNLKVRLDRLPPVPGLVQTQSFSAALMRVDWMDAVAMHPAVQRARREWEVSEQQYLVKRAELSPQLYVRVDKPLSRADYPLHTTSPSSFLGLRYSPGAGFAGLGESRAMAKRMQSQEQRIEVAERDIRQTLQSEYEEFTNARNRLLSLEQAVQGSEAVLESYARQFQAGRKTWLDLLNAVRENAQNQYSLVDTRVVMMSVMYRLSVRLGMGGELVPYL